MNKTQKQEVLEPWQKEMVQEYYANNAKKLYGIVDKILFKKHWTSDKDRFYALATDLFLKALDEFDKTKGTFGGYIYIIISLKLLSEIRDMNTQKNSNTKKIIGEDGKTTFELNPDLSLEAQINIQDYEGSRTLEDIIVDDFNIYERVFGEKRSIKFDKYIETLPRKARKVAELIGQDYKSSEIKEILHITEKQYSDAMYCIRSSEYISILY